MAGAQQTRPRLLAIVLCLAGCSFLFSASSTFLSGTPQQLRGSTADFKTVGAVAVPTAALLAPGIAGAEEMIPEPVLGIGMLSVIVVLVLIISAFAIGRGLVETIDDL